MIFIFINLLSLLATPLAAKTMDSGEIKVFYKCYAKFLDDYPPQDHPLLRAIKTNHISGRKACLSLFQNIEFDEDFHFKPQNKETLKIVSTLQKFYNSWIKMRNLNLNTQDFVNTDYYDVNESAYPLTYTFFSNSPYSNIFLGKRYFRAIRENHEKKRFFFDPYISGYRFEVHQKKWNTGATGDEESIYGPLINLKNPQLVDIGKLIGINPNSPLPNQISYKGQKGDQYLFYPQKPKGAGVLGTIPYLLANTGQINIKTTGAFNYDRRWSASVFRDFLCQELPILKEKDVVRYVKKNSSIGFLTKAKCMKCHVSMDYMAATLRNLERYHTSNADQGFTIKAIYTHPIGRQKHFIDELPEKYPHLYETPPDGKVYFRDIKGNLIAKNVHSLSEVGKVISQTDAPYYCAAQRHFAFLTGIDVPMAQIKSSFQQENKSKVISFIIDLAEQLKKKGSLKDLVANIIKSDYFSPLDRKDTKKRSEN